MCTFYTSAWLHLNWVKVDVVALDKQFVCCIKGTLDTLMLETQYCSTLLLIENNNNYLIHSLVKLSNCQKVEIELSGRFVQQDQNDNWPPDSTSEDQAQCAVHTIGKSSEAGFGLVVTALAGCREGGKSLGRASLPAHCLLTSSCLSLLGVFVTSVQLIWPALLTALC